MRLISALVLVLLAGCVTREIVVTTGKARFATYPQDLFNAFESACEGPTQSFSRRSGDLLECREFLPPTNTAAVILAFDGTVEDLPELVIRFRARAANPGYLVENDVFLNVPQRTGAPLEIRRPDPSIRRRLNALYTRAGGVPE